MAASRGDRPGRALGRPHPVIIQQPRLGAGDLPRSRLAQPPRAVALARSLVRQAPRNGLFWNTLGVACCRAGDWDAALAPLERSVELCAGGDSNDWFFLVMACCKRGQRGQALTWLDRAEQWMEKNRPQDRELKRFRAEAVALIKHSGPPPSTTCLSPAPARPGDRGPSKP